MPYESHGIHASPPISIEIRRGHVFHRACVENWLRQRETCPVCRQRVSKPVQHLLMLGQERRLKREQRRLDGLS